METSFIQKKGTCTRTSLETKYRDIADGNFKCTRLVSQYIRQLETKYRDIADGNVVD